MEALLAEYRRERNFQPQKWLENKIEKCDEYFRTNNLSGAVLSVSGGIDSAVTLGILAQVPSIKELWALNQPIDSSRWSVNRAIEVSKKFGVDLKIINQTGMYENVIDEFENNLGLETDKYSTGQLKSYMRTPINYFMAQLLSRRGYPAVVVGTGNYDEDGYLGYFCKAGDGVVDIQLISDLHKSEVYTLGKYLGVPASILEAPPSADLWPGQTDEDEMGFSYDWIEFYMGCKDKVNRDDFKDKFDKIEAIHAKNKHKFNGIISI